ncbi:MULTISPECIES: ABC transporter ATP-binding protein [unclassified Breznakia]|uniref:ABC transporter ATP-binding protein n=1 Tax=unclassified Breznakia TaxID=2623764 RepID=UPI002476E9BD|nr:MULTISPECIES: ABC transporter ATP-binding protein [unclassified Breznakia]MDH6367346.1 iron(III) transport system ATP-binding protein [Breznakia sp. PH1-1]MDH6404506.1 iron(III) transport system ATP-binding protein [Breznakia sp. PF1-11]MDH6412215.1 iron(III) transport system ATP-binding protein [Breznakia sp. PFB1-11]MDH6414513.1 iron(III) transport system ATP-binding protein [Breznakia sp. PFB1-14]MDH6416879.1 iron(III) transport system ATP-binding protein [Breznakia sp. PFB1-4]
MSVEISIRNAVKRYGENTIIEDLSLDVKNGEFFTLLGPSGCGKTTLLRMIAGFNTIEGGTFKFNDTLINTMNPEKRNIGMVFQNYAIFPNMSVRKNVEFGLKHKKNLKVDIKEETNKFLKLVKVDGYADRMPDRLSGGQQQRVALARALVIKPDVLLMDEPLSNLDAKLRVEMRTVIKEIQREVGITTIYVTHDQEEAMAVSDRIAVMKDGVIRHCSTPQKIYQRPADVFVATFIGKSNLLQAKVVKENDTQYVEFLNGYKVVFNDMKDANHEEKVTISARPEELTVHKEVQKDGIKGIVKDSVFLGLNTHYFVDLETNEEIEIIQESEIGEIIQPGSEITLTINTKKANVFSEDGSSLMHGVDNITTKEQADKAL